MPKAVVVLKLYVAGLWVEPWPEANSAATEKAAACKKIVNRPVVASSGESAVVPLSGDSLV